MAGGCQLGYNTIGEIRTVSCRVTGHNYTFFLLIWRGHGLCVSYKRWRKPSGLMSNWVRMSLRLPLYSVLEFWRLTRVFLRLCLFTSDWLSSLNFAHSLSRTSCDKLQSWEDYYFQFITSYCHTHTTSYDILPTDTTYEYQPYHDKKQINLNHC